jgi:hypothetical protein
LTHNGGGDGFVAKVQAGGSALDYCGYIGGDAWDVCSGIAVDSSENAYVTGSTTSDETTFPETVGPDLTYNSPGYADAFVAKVQAGGAGLDYCGYIGGSNREAGSAIAVDSVGRAHVTGETLSDGATFPLVDGPDLTFGGGVSDAYVARVTAGGTLLDYCGYIGGQGSEEGRGIALDGAGNAYVAGWSSSSEAQGFPVAIGPDPTFNGGMWDGFVARVGENRAPKLGTVTPSSGRSRVGETVHISTTWKDADGWQDLKQCYFHIGASPSLRNNVTLMYNARKNKLWLLGDDGSTWLGGSAPGSPRPIENSQATLQVSLVKVTGWNDTVQVRWVLEFKEAYIGVKRTGLKCKDEHKAKAKGAWKGTWTITP